MTDFKPQDDSSDQDPLCYEGSSVKVWPLGNGTLHVTVPQDEVPGQDPLLLGFVGTHWTRKLWWDVALVLNMTV